MKKTLLLFLLLLFPRASYGDQNWTSWRKINPTILSIAFEDNIIWCGTPGGVLKYDKNTGNVRSYTTDDGLLNDMVYSVAVDHDGNKWFGSKWGVSKLDGVSWKSDQMISEFWDMAIEHNNVLWAATSKGIRKYVDGAWQKVTDEKYSCLTVDNNGIMWAGSTTLLSNKNYILRLNNSNETMIGAESIPVNYQPVRDITFDPVSGLVWSAVHFGFVSYDDREKKLTEYYSKEPDIRSYNAIAADENVTVWLGNTKGLTRFRDGEETLFTVDDGLIDNRIHSLAIDKDGVLWIGTELGLASYYNEKFTIHLEAGLYASHIASIVIDNDNTVWCSHMGEMRIDNLSYFKNGKWSTGPNGIYSLRAVDNHNMLWGTKNSLYSYDGKEIINHIIRVPIPGFECDTTSPGHIEDIHIDEDDIFWIASLNASGGDCTTSGIFTYDGETVIPKILGDFSSIAMDSKKNVWCGGSWNGLYEYDGNEWTHFTELDGLPGTKIWHVEVDRNDIVWFSVFHDAGDEGYHSFMSYDDKSFTEYTAENSGFLKARIFSITADRNNTKWIGTDAGVCRFDGESWTTFTKANSGLCDNKVNAIAVETNNTIWFGTDNGVSKYTGEVITTGVDEEDEIPEALPVLHSFPNPFNPSTTIEFTLPESGFTTLSIYNISGQKVRELAAGHLTFGAHSLTWDGRDDSGDAVSSGVYITRLVAGKQVAAGRMILLK